MLHFWLLHSLYVPPSIPCDRVGVPVDNLDTIGCGVQYFAVNGHRVRCLRFLAASIDIDRLAANGSAGLTIQ